MALSFAPASLDLYVSNDIMEHVPSIDRVLAEARRVLKAGGYFIATFPFRYMDEDSLTKTLTGDDGRPVHLTEPSSTTIRSNPAGGSLVFTVPGWEILRQCTAAGFAAAQFEFISSCRHGVLGGEIARGIRAGGAGLAALSLAAGLGMAGAAGCRGKGYQRVSPVDRPIGEGRDAPWGVE